MSLSYNEYQQTNYFQGLDGLRCLSVLAVVWHHTGDGNAAAFLPILERGYLGVTMFFAISGYLITTLLLRELRLNQKIDLKKFMMRRALRIFPLYYAVLGLYIVLVAVLESESQAGRDFWQNLPYFLSYTSNFFVPLIDGRVIFYFSWSLATEEQFYLLWPGMLAFLKPRLGAYLIFSLALFIALNSVLSLTDNPIIRAIPLAICLGTLLALIAESRTGFRCLKSISGQSWMPIVFIVLLLLALNNSSLSMEIVSLLMTLLIFSLVINSHSIATKALGANWILYVGKVSYGIYLLHQLVAKCVILALSMLSLDHITPLVFLSTVVLTIAAATLSYYLFERRFLNYKKHYSVGTA